MTFKGQEKWSFSCRVTTGNEDLECQIKNQLTDRSDRLLPGLEELDAVLDHLRASVEVL